MSSNQRIDYSASLREGALYPKVLRAPVMVLSPPPRILTLLCAALVVAVSALSLGAAACAGSRRVPVHRAALRLLGVGLAAASFAAHCAAFWRDEVYSVRKTLLTTAVGVAGGLLAWFSPRMAAGLRR